MSAALYLRFADETAALAAFAALDLAIVDDMGAAILPEVIEQGGTIVNICPLGTLYRPTGETATDPQTGVTYPTLAAIAGWHVNVLVDGGSAPDFGAALISPRPATPDVVWATQ